MYKVNIRAKDPARYAQVMAEQEALKKAYSSSITIARLCPYCDHKIEILCRVRIAAATPDVQMAVNRYSFHRCHSGGYN